MVQDMVRFRQDFLPKRSNLFDPRKISFRSCRHVLQIPSTVPQVSKGACGGKKVTRCVHLRWFGDVRSIGFLCEVPLIGVHG